MTHIDSEPGPGWNYGGTAVLTFFGQKSWLEHGLNLEVSFFGAEKSVFYYRAPDFANGPFVALGKTVDFGPKIRALL